MDAWVSEKMERDVWFENGVDAILNAHKVYRWFTINMNGANVLWGQRVNKIEKLKEFQTAYNKLQEYYYDWDDDEDLEKFALKEDLNEWIQEERPVYHNEPLPEWFTKYPMIF